MADSGLNDAVVLVTGATDGIGRATAVRLAGRGATVLVHGRDEGKAADTVAAVRAASEPADGAAYLADLADRDAVYGLAERVRADHDALDVLVNNAGTWQGSLRYAPSWGDDDDGATVADPPTDDGAAEGLGRRGDGGVEYTMAVNHLAPFLLTNLLAPALHMRAPARVVTVTSALHRRGELSDLEAAFAPEAFDSRGAYADSKLAALLFSLELADRLDGVGVHAVHPGTIPETALARDAHPVARAVWRLLGFVPGVTDGPEDGARAVEHAATSSALDGRTGTYLVERSATEPAGAAEDAGLRERLWQRSAALSGLPPGVPAVDPLSR